MCPPSVVYVRAQPSPISPLMGWGYKGDHYGYGAATIHAAPLASYGPSESVHLQGDRLVASNSCKSVPRVFPRRCHVTTPSSG